MAGRNTTAVEFEDSLPLMADKLGGEGLIRELCNGFQLLMDTDKQLITFESLKNNSALLGLQDLTHDELRSMVKEGDMDGDGALNQMEFCVLMFRLSPDLMRESEVWLQQAKQDLHNSWFDAKSH
ncbi:calcium-binding protein KRP1-like [Cornus florida]|uniref:calcium-binding protein KRP1-like n=1 Tax=Cornus florida TaxID=4283 RepID=UPI00289AB1CA|nr:calcium-binding protein KRP1-like [Cornus florida]